MPKREDDLLINDIVENAEAVFQFVNNDDNYEAFISDKMKVYAVIRAFEIIGEAAKLVSEEFKLSYPMIEWRLMTQFRNLLIHEYFGIDYEKVWDIIQNELPFNYKFLKELEF